MRPKSSPDSAPATATGNQDFNTLIAALRAPGCYAHAVQGVEVLQTHISCILLAGEYAYKIKKPLNLGFLDFSTLPARRHYCEEELRLNRRTAPELYLDVIPIGGSAQMPVLGSREPAIEYALRMRRFPQDALLERMARRGMLTPQHIDALASNLAAFHARIERTDAQSAFGSPEHILAQALQNFDQLLSLTRHANHPNAGRRIPRRGGGRQVVQPSTGGAKAELALLERLRDWTAGRHASLSAVFRARQREGWVRECHGDLHLGNIALLAGVPTPFDGIEFSADLRWTDTMNEVAFLMMDLLDHRLPRLAFRFLNAYLELTGDYAGMRVLRFYLVYRALVRAKVSCLRAHQAGISGRVKSDLAHEYRRYLLLAERIAASGHAAMLIMHGLSGSGKTSIARGLQEALGAVCLRSDVVRKRLHGLAAMARSASGLGEGLYAPGASERTYAHLANLAREVLAARYPVIVDAAFLERAERDRFRRVARDAGAGFLIAACSAAEATLRERIALRERAASDASEASLAVLERQLATRETLAADETAYTLDIDAEHSAGHAEAAAVAARLDLALT